MGDTVLAILLSTVLLVLGLLVMAADSWPLARCIKWSLEHELVEGGSEINAKSRVQEEVEELGAMGIDASMNVSPDGLLLLVCASDIESLGPARDRMVSAGLRVESFEMGRRFSFWANDFLSDPLSVSKRLWGSASWVLATSPVAFLVVGLLRRRSRRTGAGEKSAPALSRTLVVGTGVGLVGAAGGAALEAMQGWLGYAVGEQGWIEAAANGGPIGVVFLILVAVGLSPLAEEVFFRGHLFAMTREAAGRAAAYVISMSLFAVVHANPSALPSYLWSGFFLAWAYERWRHLSIPVLAHSVHNLIAVGVLVFR